LEGSKQACGVVLALLGTAPAAAAGTAPLEAHFASRSYEQGATARLVVSAPGTPRVKVQVFRSGPERVVTRRDDLMRGVAVNDPRSVRTGGVKVQIRFWPPGLYFARLSVGSRVAFAPFVLRASPLMRPRAAVVIPTNTWQAYNLRDDDGDGMPNSWYASDAVTTVSLSRPYGLRGVPRFFRHYDLQFIRWLARTRKDADYLADDDLETIGSPLALASRYDLIVFAGHEEYVTPHAFDLVAKYRDRGGNLIFLSANNFFYRVIRSGQTITRAGRWRDLGRPEAAFIGVQYVGWFENRFPNRPYIVTGSRRVPWLFRGTGLADGSRFGSFGLEIDARAAESPAGTQVLATIPDTFGPGLTAEMTYYTTPAGAKVFAAGVLNFGGSALIPPLPRLLDNLWTALSVP
jgi:hypothetical protein